MILKMKTDTKPVQQSADKKLFWIYALKLENNKYYIGITSKKNPQDRIRAHGSFYGAKWTSLNKPIETIKLKKLGYLDLEEAELIEQALTLKYVKKYGHNNVRGGNLNYSGEYVRIGNKYIRKIAWDLALGLFLMTASFVALLIIFYVKK